MKKEPIWMQFLNESWMIILVGFSSPRISHLLFIDLFVLIDGISDRRAPCPTVSMCLDVADRLCALRIIAMTPKSPAMFDKRLDLLCNVFDVNFALKKKPDEVAVTK
jgi:hypothetical protein